MTICGPILSVRDKGRIMEALERALRSGTSDARTVESFWAEMRRAQLVASADVPDDVITMNSRFDLLDLRTGEASCHTLVYPEAESPACGRISVISSPGMVLVGARVGDVVRWNRTRGPAAARVERIRYQPEAAGHYHV